MEATSKRIIEPIKLEAYQCPVCDVKLFTDLKTATEHVNIPVQPIFPKGFIHRVKISKNPSYFVYSVIVESPGYWCQPRDYLHSESNHTHEQNAIIYDTTSISDNFEDDYTDKTNWPSFVWKYKAGHIELLGEQETERLQEKYSIFRKKMLTNPKYRARKVWSYLRDAPAKLVRTTPELEELLKK